jgi:hypothetical protein
VGIRRLQLGFVLDRGLDVDAVRVVGRSVGWMGPSGLRLAAH